ncbi:MAG: hypothetical protein ACRENB_16940 [Gemmatimonadales bacterium]
MTMRRLAQWTRLLAAAGVLGVAGCKNLDIQNPNAPDAERAFSDPDAIAGLVTGGFRNWMLTHESYNGSLLLSTMADAHTASWNNFNIRYYSSVGNECPVRCGWANSNTSSFRFQIETYWYGYYSVLSSANDVLTAIRNNGVVIGSAANTRVVEFGAALLQAMVLSEIALNYDQGFVVDEDTDLTTLELVPRSEVRDAAIAKFDAAIAIAGTNFSSPAEWTGVVNGTAYTSAQWIKLARTMQARLLAYYPRTAAENGTVNWGQVTTYASQGLSSGTPNDLQFYQDFNVLFSGIKNWSNDLTTMRVDTRLAAIIAPPQVHPWPEAAGGNPQPNSPDHRVGNGTWGPEDDFLGVGTLAEDAGAGTDYAYAGIPIFLPARGQYHQSNLGQIRYSFTAYPGYGLPGEDGTGQFPVLTATMNDLLWAEGLVRSGGSAATAATLINKTRVGRGNLAAATAGEGTASLLTKVQYEQDIELLGIGASPYYNRRRIDGLQAMTPRHMPVPAKELLILRLELYSFGGPGNPAGLAPPTTPDGRVVRTVRQQWAEIMAHEKQQARSRSRG